MRPRTKIQYIKKILIVASLLIVGVFLVGYVRNSSSKYIDENNLPKIIQADWIDLNHISHITKFRSGSGHDFSGNGETCRSMKHYFNAIRTEEEQKIVGKNNGSPPPFSLENAIPIYSPVDGTIVDIEEDGPIGDQIYIQSAQYSDFTVRLFHIFLLDGYKKGSKVAAGEQIGNIGRIQNTDIAVSIGSPHGHKFVSYFQVMPDEIFAKYQAAGVRDRDQLIITKEYRDAHPLECRGEWFAKNYDRDSDQFVFINENKPFGDNKYFPR